MRVEKRINEAHRFMPIEFFEILAKRGRRFLRLSWRGFFSIILQYSDYGLLHISTLTKAAMESVHHICTLAPLLRAFYPLPFPWSGSILFSQLLQTLQSLSFPSERYE